VDPGIVDIAIILARAYLRLAERSRDDAVSSVATEQIPLEVSRPESPDHVVEPAARRSS